MTDTARGLPSPQKHRRASKMRRPDTAADVIEIAIRQRGDDGDHQVEVIRSEFGEGSVTVGLATADLTARWNGLRESLPFSGSRSIRPTRPVDRPEQESNPRGRDAGERQDHHLDPSERELQELGTKLFDALLGIEPVSGYYRAAVTAARAGGRRLRVVVRLDAPLLTGLPWEAMYDKVARDYLVSDCDLIRWVPGPATAVAQLTVTPLRVLCVISSPRGMSELEADREYRQLEKALENPIRRGLVQVHRTSRATWSAIHEELRRDGPWHVVHYIGHGSFDSIRDEGTLYLENGDGDPDPVGANRLANLLSSPGMPYLVVLNCCSGATTGDDLSSGIATRMIHRGVSAIVAMQHIISDGAAIAFADGFYTQLARSGRIDEAVDYGRKEILGRSGSLEWVTPVVYQKGEQTRLYDGLRGATRLSGRRRILLPLVLASVVLATIAISLVAVPLARRPSSPDGRHPAPRPAGHAPSGSTSPTLAANTPTGNVPSGGSSPAAPVLSASSRSNPPAANNTAPSCPSPAIRCVLALPAGDRAKPYDPEPRNNTVRASYKSASECHPRSGRTACLELTWNMDPADYNASTTYGMRLEPPVDLSQYQGILLWVKYSSGTRRYFEVLLHLRDGADAMARVAPDRQSPTAESDWTPVSLPFSAFTPVGGGTLDLHEVSELKFVWNSASGSATMNVDEISFTK